MNLDPGRIRVEAGSARGRYVYRFPDGSEAEMRYFESAPGVVTITHTETPARHRGRGVAAALVAHAVAEFRAGGRQVVPLCSFARRQPGVV